MYRAPEASAHPYVYHPDGNAVLSFHLDSAGFKDYCSRFGPGRERPPRPSRCAFCEFAQVWYDGWRYVFVTVLVDGEAQRASGGVALQRVCCARPDCGRSWTLRPMWAYPHRSLEVDVAEAAAFAYLPDADATYQDVAATCRCSWVTVWTWLGWLSRLASPRMLLARAARLGTGGAIADLLPRAVAASRRARTRARARLLLRAWQVLTALAILHRSQPEPPSDPSPLRWFVVTELGESGRKALLHGSGLSPARDKAARGPPR